MPKTKTVTAKRAAKTRKPAQRQTTAIATRPAPTQPGDQQMDAISRFVLDPAVDVEKLERVIALQERARAEASRVSFFAALAQLQAKLPKIGKGGTIHQKGGTKVRNRYSKMGDDILPAIKPMLAEYGFSMHWRTAFFSDDGKRMLRVTGLLSHELGWSEESVFEAPPDVHDSRNYVQSLGSTISYGHRYTMVDLLNLEMADDIADDDGQNATGSAPQKESSKPASAQSPNRQSAKSDVLVSDAQLKRLYTVANKANRSKDEIKSWLAVRFNIDSSKQITQRDYDTIVDAIQAPGALGGPPRDPGEEG